MTVARYAALALSALLMGCSVLRPLPDTTSLDDRLAAFPTTGLPLEGGRDHRLEREPGSLHHG